MSRSSIAKRANATADRACHRSCLTVFNFGELQNKQEKRELYAANVHVKDAE